MGEERTRIKISLVKIREKEDAVHPGNIQVGSQHSGYRFIEDFDPPEVGKAFWISYNWRTSPVTKIIDNHTFETLNSVYEWTYTPENIDITKMY